VVLNSIWNLTRNQSLRVVMLTLWTMSQAKGGTLVRVVLGILLFGCVISCRETCKGAQAILFSSPSEPLGGLLNGIYKALNLTESFEKVGTGTMFVNYAGMFGSLFFTTPPFSRFASIPSALKTSILFISETPLYVGICIGRINVAD
jgi:hypothetical protein